MRLAPEEKNVYVARDALHHWTITVSSTVSPVYYFFIGQQNRPLLNLEIPKINFGNVFVNRVGRCAMDLVD